MEGLSAPCDTLRKRLRTAENATLGKIDELIAVVQECRNGSQNKDTVIDSVKHLRKRSKTLTKEVIAAHKDLHAPVSKFGKAIDKVFASAEDTQALIQSSDDPFKGKESHINYAVMEYLFRRGKCPIAEQFAKAANLDLRDSQKQSFIQLYTILEAFQSKDLQPAIEWAQSSTKELRFKLHRLQYLKLLKAGDTVAAIQYSQTHLASFTGFFFDVLDLKRLMGALLFIGSQSCDSPYVDLWRDDLWREAAELFTQVYCSQAGLASKSPLAESISTGCLAWPRLLKFAKVMKATKQDGSVWNAGNELPIEIDVGKKKRYHTIFACPVSREQSTPDNPPMRLPCGHVISQDSLKQLSKGGHKRRFKCTYCPSEQTMAEAQKLSF